MKTTKILLGITVACVLGLPLSASAGDYTRYVSGSQGAVSTGMVSGGSGGVVSGGTNCGGSTGTLCPPGPATEEIVPEYFDVPSKVRHVYYDKPASEAVLTHVVHHVPTPVYGRTTITESVQGGQWTGPRTVCCQQQRAVTQVVRPTVTQVVRPIVPVPMPQPVPVPCQARPYCR